MSEKIFETSLPRQYTSYDALIHPIPRIRQPKFGSSRNRPASDRHEWHNAYFPQLIIMYDMVQEIINEKYPKNKIDWDNPRHLNNFSRLIYHCSSKLISPYLEDPGSWWESESKHSDTIDKEDGEEE